MEESQDIFSRCETKNKKYMMKKNVTQQLPGRKAVRGLLSVVLLLWAVVAASAQNGPVVMRNCRPQLTEKGIPAHAAARHAPAILSQQPKGLRRAESQNPLIGKRRQLVVMTSFPDKPFEGDETSTLKLWDKILNAEHLNEEPFHGSLHDYFYDQSYGQFDVTFDLYYYELPDSMVKYRSTDTDDENSKYLVADVVNHLKTLNLDWAPYDWDDNGYVDQLLIIYVGKGQNDGGGSKSIWPHQWWMSMHGNSQAITVTSGGKQYLIDCYCCVQEKSGSNDYGSFGTLCHEYSHCFGLPDFYEGNTTYVDDWDLMDHGNYCGGGFQPCGYSAFERTFMGWLTPVELTSDTTVTDIPALNEKPQAYLIRNDGEPQEYYLVENRQQTGWDTQIPGNGIIIAHVDYDEEIFRVGLPNTSKRQRYTLFAANNHPEPTNSKWEGGWAYPWIDNSNENAPERNDELTNTSEPASTLNNPNTDGSYLMSKPLTKMDVADGLASFHFQAHETSAINQLKADDQFGDTSAQGKTLYYDLSGRQLGTNPAGLPAGIYVVKTGKATHKAVIK